MKHPQSDVVSHGEITFMGEKFFCDHMGALFWPAQNCMIVSDLHLEKSAAMAARGNLVPPYDSNDTLDKIQSCIARWSPVTIISLGDSFHREDSADNLSPTLRERIINFTANHNWRWITGNHDPRAPQNLGGSSASEITIGQVIFRHEQDLASPFGEISGHLHPAAKLTRRAKTMRRRCFVSDDKRMILPAFGAFTGGLDLFNSAYDNVLDRKNMKIWMLGKEQVYPICASNLVTK